VGGGISVDATGIGCCVGIGAGTGMGDGIGMGAIWGAAGSGVGCAGAGTGAAGTGTGWAGIAAADGWGSRVVSGEVGSVAGALGNGPLRRGR